MEEDEGGGGVEWVACDDCGSNDAVVLPRETRVIRATLPCQAVRCRGCGLMYLNPRPGRHEVEGRYGPSFLQAYAETTGMAGGLRELPSYLEERLERLERWVVKGDLLEVGPGAGLFLRRARERGWKVVGLEVSEVLAQELRSEHALDVRAGTLETAGFEPSSFDVVHMNHVLEHLPSPRDALWRVRRLLRTQGVLALEAPNEFRNILSWMRMRVDPGGALDPLPSSHLYFFTPRTLGRLITRSGFRIGELHSPRRNLESGFWWGGAAKRAAALGEFLFNCGPVVEVIAVKHTN